LIPKEVEEKLKKLLTFKEDAEKRDSQAELENVTARIQEVLFKYNIELSSLNFKEEPQINQYTMKFDISKTEGLWVYKLSHVIAEHNLCSSISNSQYHLVYIIGKPVNVEIVQYTIESLISRIKIMSKIAYKEYIGPEKKNAFLRGYYMGVVVGIKCKLDTEFEKLKKDSQINALVLSNKDAIKVYENKMYPDAKVKKLRELSAEDGFYKGVIDGNNISINKGLNSNNLGQKLIK
jgi:hypothetical protein